MESVTTLLRAARASQASDVHLEPTENGGTIRFRVEGGLSCHADLGSSEYQTLIYALKQTAGMDLEQNALPQDGRISFKEEAPLGEEGALEPVWRDTRIAVGPGTLGEAACIRFLEPIDFRAYIENPQRVLSDAVREAAFEDASLPHGLILVTGPSGSGKTTSLYTLLGSQVNEEVKALAVGNLDEVQLPGVQHIQVKPKLGFFESTAIRYALEMDPDLLLVNEIVDSESATLMLGAAVSGRRVFSCMHTTSAVHSLGRLLDLGLDPFLIADGVRAVMGQRLVRRLDPGEKEEAPEDIPRVRGILGEACPENFMPYKSKQGKYRGRVAIQEYLRMTPEVREQVLKGGSRQDLLRVARNHGFRTLLENGALEVAAGRVSLSELVRVCRA